MAGPRRDGGRTGEQTYQQEARHKYYWHTHHMYPDVYGVAVVGAIEDQVLFQIQRHVGGEGQGGCRLSREEVSPEQ